MNNRAGFFVVLSIILTASPIAARDPGLEFNFYDGIVKSPYAFFVPTIASWLCMNSSIAFYTRKTSEQTAAFAGFLAGLFFSGGSYVAGEYGSSYKYLGRWTTLALCAAATSIIIACGNKVPEDTKAQMGITYASCLIGIVTSYLLFTYG